MPEVGTDLADFAERELRSRGIEIRTGTTLEEVTEDTARLSDGAVVPTRTRRLDRRGQAAPGRRAARPAARRTRGRIDVDSTLQVDGHERRLGDRRRRRGARTRPSAARSPARRPHSTRSARAASSARNVAATIGNGRVKPFRYKTKGVFVDMGQGEAVAQTLGIKWRGKQAWLLARSYHLAMMPGLKRRVRLLVDWNVQLIFGRDASELGGLGHPPRLAEETSAARRPTCRQRPRGRRRRRGAAPPRRMPSGPVRGPRTLGGT